MQADATHPDTTPARWQVEVSVSPEWFALQDSSLQPPVPDGSRVVDVSEGYALIGRESDSRDVHPLVDAGDDSGCSRRHADLTLTDGHWVVRDLTSVNGTHVQAAGAAFPPVEITEPTPVSPGDAIYVGAWTRIVLRPANAG